MPKRRELTAAELIAEIDKGFAEALEAGRQKAFAAGMSPAEVEAGMKQFEERVRLLRYVTVASIRRQQKTGNPWRQ